jgi:hypothetical protein
VLIRGRVEERRETKEERTGLGKRNRAKRSSSERKQKIECISMVNPNVICSRSGREQK